MEQCCCALCAIFSFLVIFVRATYLFVRNVFWMGTVETMVRQYVAGLSVESQLIFGDCRCSTVNGWFKASRRTRRVLGRCIILV